MAKSKEQPPQPQEKPPEKPKDGDTSWGWLLLIGALLWSNNKRGRR